MTVAPGANMTISTGGGGIFGAKTPRLLEWAQKADAAYALTSKLYRSGFMPMAYKTGTGGRPLDEETIIANGTAAILLGDSLGLDPLTSWQVLYVANGKVGMYAKFMLGLLESKKFRFEFPERHEEAVTVRGRRPDSEDWVEIRVTIEQARKARWTSNPLYQSIPADMLTWRAVERVCYLIGSDELHGLAAAEAIEDMDTGPVVEDAPRPERVLTGGQSGALERARGVAAEASTAVTALRGLMAAREGTTAPTPAHTPAPGPVEAPRAAESRGRPVRLEEVPETTRRALFPEGDPLPAKTYEPAPVPPTMLTGGQFEPEPEGATYDVDPETLDRVDEAITEPWMNDEEYAAAVATVERIAGGTQIPDTTPGIEYTDEPLSASRWDEINGLLNKRHDINGDGSRTARYKVIEFVTGKKIEKGSDLTRRDGDELIEWLTEHDRATVQKIAWSRE